MLAQLQRAEREERAEDPDDPEAHDHLRLAPPLHLEVVMQRRAPEDAMLLRVLESVPSPAVLEHEPLEDHRHRLGDEHDADEDEQELAT